MIVLDASVILKWIFEEDEDSCERALRYRDDHVTGRSIIAVPELFFYEIANVLSTKTLIGKEDAAEAFSLLWDFNLEHFDFGKEEFISAMSLAKEMHVTLYDAAYIELARRLNCPFITADRKLYAKTKGLKEVAPL